MRSELEISINIEMFVVYSHFLHTKHLLLHQKEIHLSKIYIDLNYSIQDRQVE